MRSFQLPNGWGRCATLVVSLIGLILLATPSPGAGQIPGTPNEGGTGLYLDGVDDFFVAFPTFELLSDWTVELWVEPLRSVWGHPQCLLHLTTYSLEDLFKLELDDDRWTLQYGAQELQPVVELAPVSVLQPLSNSSNTSNISDTPSETPSVVNITRRHHVAVTHRIITSSEAELSLYVDGGLLATANFSRPTILVPLLPFIVGACSVPETNGFARARHFVGQVDELRHWTVARSQGDILSAMNYSGPLARWPTQLSTTGIAAQYNFDTMSDFEVMDSSGQGNNGVRGSGGVSSELPRYERSVFDNLNLGSRFYEFRAHPTAACSSDNCLNLTHLLTSVPGVNYNAFAILSAPTNLASGIFLTYPGNTTALSNNMLVPQGSFVLHTQSPVAFDSFRLQLCTGLPNEVPQLSRCFGQPIYEVTFRVLESRPPTAGRSIELQFPGHDGFLELREHLPESATVEFWAQLSHLDGEQTLFSVSDRQTGASMVSLGLSNGRFNFHFCSAVPPSGGVQPFTLSLPDMLTTEPQHIAISWEYVRSARGRAIYMVNVYRNCTPMTSEPTEVKDACAHFGSDSAAANLRFPTFGQHYTPGRAGLESTAFASAHIDDIRIWNRPVPGQEICSRQQAFLGGTESGLQAYFPISSADEQRHGDVVENRVAGGADADLRCTSIRHACSFERGRGFAFRPSLFAVAPELLLAETSAGNVDGSRMLPALEVHMPAYDVDNYVDYDLAVRSYDGVQVQIRSLPDPQCGTIHFGNQPQVAVSSSSVIAPEALPLLFTPNRLVVTDLNLHECLTSVTYDVADTHGLRSAFASEVNIAVRAVGPRVQAVEMLDPGISDSQLDVGDIILVRFDRPTTAPSDWQRMFEVIDGSLGSGNVSGSWNTAGDALLLELTGIPGDLQLTAGLSRLNFLGMSGTQVRTAGNVSYPCTGTSPLLQGSFGQAYCNDNDVFSKSEARCVACGEGNYRSADGLRCLPCAPGTFRPAGSAGLCQPCAVGTYLPAGAASRAECIPAAPGYYVPREALVTQFTCPQGMLAESSGSSTCVRCPEGSSCETAQHFRSLAVPQSSHFRTATGQIKPCKIAAACQGWDLQAGSNTCVEGMRGYLCQTCASDWWRAYDQLYSVCKKCGSGGAVGFVLIIILGTACIWLLGLLSIDAALWGNMHAVIIRSLLNFFTAVTVMSHIQSWELDGALGSGRARITTTILHVLFRFSGGVPANLMGLECLSGGSQWQLVKIQTALWFAMPAVWMAFMGLLGIAIFQCYTMKTKLRRTVNQDVFKKDNFKRAATNSLHEFANEQRFLGIFRKRAERCPFGDRMKLVLTDCMPLFTTCYFVLLPTVMRMMVAPLACHKLGETGSEWRLLADPEVTCWQGEHVGYFIFGIIGILLWGLAVPLLVFVQIWRKQEEIEQDAHVRINVMWLIDGYEPHYFLWEFVVHIRRVLLTLVAAWPDLSRSSELAMYQSIGIAALLLHYSHKPFDNRAGELLDRAERSGLSAFLLVVTMMQIVLQVNPTGKEDMLPVLMISLVASLSLLVPCSFFTIEMYVKVSSAVLMVILLALERADSSASQNRLLSFALVMFSIAVNALFVLFMLRHMVTQLWDALSEVLSRQAKPISQTTDSFFRKPKEAWEIGANTKNMIAVTLPEATFTPKPDLPDPGNRLWNKIAQFIISSHSEANKGLIRFDAETNELILGLHQSTFMNDTTLSSYTRKQLAKLGPFISEEERRFVAYSIRDALRHIIVDCDLRHVPCTILEFLIRVTFAWCYAERLTRIEDEPKAIWQKPGQGGMVLLGAASTNSSAFSMNSSGDVRNIQDKEFGDQLFDKRIFSYGVTAEDFQAKLEQITMMPKYEVERLLEDFLQTRAVYMLNGTLRLGS